MENQDVLGDLIVELHKLGKRYDTVDDLRAAVEQARYRLTYRRGAMQWSTDEDVGVYFRDRNGGVYRDDQLFFQPNARNPLPDLVCRYSSELQFRTRFYLEEGKIEHEVLVEPVKSGSSRIVRRRKGLKAGPFSRAGRSLQSPAP